MFTTIFLKQCLKCFAIAASIPRLRLVEASLMLIYNVHVDVI